MKSHHLLFFVVLILYQALANMEYSRVMAREIFFNKLVKPTMSYELATESKSQNLIKVHFSRYFSNGSSLTKNKNNIGNGDDKRMVPTGPNPLHNR